MPKFTPELTRMLLIRGISRAVLPLSVLWGILDWYFVDGRYALAFAVLSINYPIVYALSWTAPAYMHGVLRIRPWQTFVLLFNAVLLPVFFYRACGRLPYGFIGITILAFIGLFVSTLIHFHLNERLPMAGIFAQRRQQKAGAAVARPGAPVAVSAEASSAASDNPT